jgi:hypothetical protein
MKWHIIQTTRGLLIAFIVVFMINLDSFKKSNIIIYILRIKFLNLEALLDIIINL